MWLNCTWEVDDEWGFGYFYALYSYAHPSNLTDTVRITVTVKCALINTGLFHLNPTRCTGDYGSCNVSFKLLVSSEVPSNEGYSADRAGATVIRIWQHSIHTHSTEPSSERQL